MSRGIYPIPKHSGDKPPRLCVVCGARVININQRCVTCSPACTFANENGITRERAIRLMPDLRDFPIDARMH